MESTLISDIDIARALGDILGVERVYVAHAGDVVAVITVVDREDENTYDTIYSRERALIRESRALHFDFTVGARRGRPAEDLLGPDPPTWRRD